MQLQRCAPRAACRHAPVVFTVAVLIAAAGGTTMAATTLPTTLPAKAPANIDQRITRVTAQSIDNNGAQPPRRPESLYQPYDCDPNTHAWCDQWHKTKRYTLKNRFQTGPQGQGVWSTGAHAVDHTVWLRFDFSTTVAVHAIRLYHTADVTSNRFPAKVDVQCADGGKRAAFKTFTPKSPAKCPGGEAAGICDEYAELDMGQAPYVHDHVVLRFTARPVPGGGLRAVHLLALDFVGLPATGKTPTCSLPSTTIPATAAAPAGATKYQYGDVNSLVCPSGSARVLDTAGCRAVAAQEGKTVRPWTATRYPSGCWKYNSGTTAAPTFTIYHNTAINDRANAKAQVACAGDSTTATTPAATTNPASTTITTTVATNAAPSTTTAMSTVNTPTSKTSVTTTTTPTPMNIVAIAPTTNVTTITTSVTNITTAITTTYATFDAKVLGKVLILTTEGNLSTVSQADTEELRNAIKGQFPEAANVTSSSSWRLMIIEVAFASNESVARAYDDKDALGAAASTMAKALKQAPLRPHSECVSLKNVWADSNCTRWVADDPARCDAGNPQQYCARTCCDPPARQGVPAADVDREDMGNSSDAELGATTAIASDAASGSGNDSDAGAIVGIIIALLFVGAAIACCVCARSKGGFMPLYEAVRSRLRARDRQPSSSVYQRPDRPATDGEAHKDEKNDGDFPLATLSTIAKATDATATATASNNNHNGANVGQDNTLTRCVSLACHVQYSAVLHAQTHCACLPLAVAVTCTV